MGHKLILTDISESTQMNAKFKDYLLTRSVLREMKVKESKDRSWGCSSVVKCILSEYKALVLISCMRERKEEKGRKEKSREGGREGKIGYQMK